MNFKSILYWIIGIFLLIVIGKIFIFFLPVILILLVFYLIFKKDKVPIQGNNDENSANRPKKEIVLDKDDFEVIDEE